MQIIILATSLWQKRALRSNEQDVKNGLRKIKQLSLVQFKPNSSTINASLYRENSNPSLALNQDTSNKKYIA